MDEVLDLCNEHNLVLIKLLPPSPGSRFLAQVKNQTGQLLLLKGAEPGFEVSYGEVEALAAFSQTNVSPQLVGRFANGVSLREWIEGRALHELDNHGYDYLLEVGALARALHTAPTTNLNPLSILFDEHVKEVEMSRALTADQRREALARAERIRQSAAPKVALHGDFHPSNILLVEGGLSLVAIDPFGYQGSAAFDLATYAVALPYPDPRKVFNLLLSGYGERIELAEEMFGFVVMAYFAFLRRRECLTQAELLREEVERLTE